MNRTRQRGIWILLAAVLVVSGCGRKEAPQIVHDGAKPELTDFRHEQNGNIVLFYFTLRGDPAGVGYQIDRAEIDPYCKCPGLWRRYFEQEPMPKLANRESRRIINLKTTEREFAFRVRAFDAEGNIGAWSPVVRVRAIDLFDR